MKVRSSGEDTMKWFENRKNENWRYWAACVAMGLLTAWATAGAVHSAGHHIIFLVDQSGSMCRMHGPGETWPPNDPEGNRTEAVLQTFDRLNFHINQERDPSIRHTLCVVEFGSHSTVHPPVQIGFDPNLTPEQRSRNLSQARQQLAGLMYSGNRGMDYTDTRDGLTTVDNLIQTLGNLNREHCHVFLVTDGKPYIEGGVPINSIYAVDMGRIADNLRTRTSLDVVGLIGDAHKNQYWGDWGPYWTRHADSAIQADKAFNISMLIDDLLGDRMEIAGQMHNAGNPYFCPPYLKTIIFTVYKIRPGAGTVITDPLNRTYRDDSPGTTFQRENTYDRIAIENPVPGEWNLSLQDVQIKVEHFYRRIQRDQPEGSVNCNVPVKFQYQVLSDQGDPFKEVAGYPVQAELIITEPPGQMHTLNLDHDGNGVFSNRQPFVFLLSGSAHLHLSARTNNPDPNVPFTEVFSLDESLVVTDRTLVAINAGGSLPGVCELNFGSRTMSPRLQLELESQLGTPVSLNMVSSQPDQLVRSRWLQPDGSSLTDSTATYAHGGGEWIEGAIPVSQSIFSLDWLTRRGASYAVFEINDSVLNHDYMIRRFIRDDKNPDINPSSVIPALQTNPLAVPVTYHESLWSYLVILITGGILGLIIVYFLYRYGRKLIHLVLDRVYHRTVKVIIQPHMASEDEKVKKTITGDYLCRYKKAAVGIRFGPDDEPMWNPDYLKIKRLFRPWSGKVAVKLTYPGTPGKKKKFVSTIVVEGQPPVALSGFSGSVLASVEVNRPRQGVSQSTKVWNS